MSNNEIPSLCESLKQYFNVGVAVPQFMIQKNMPEIEIVKKHFNEVVAENCTKMQYVYPEEGRFFWDEADEFVKFAKDNNKKIRWHTFVWHSQSPIWIFFDNYNPPPMPKFDFSKFDPSEMQDKKPDPADFAKFDFKKFDPIEIAKTEKLATKEQLENRVKKYIQAVTDRYKGLVSSYDVVNEVISDKRFGLRTKDDHSLWQEIMGADYVEKAFYWAHECDPNADLVINDYNLEIITEKRDGQFEFVKSMLAKGVPISTVGLQMHISMFNSIPLIEETIEKFASLGVKVIVTEMDVSIHGQDDKEPKVLTPELLNKQADYYYDLFEAFKRQAKKGNLTDVVWWGVTDKFTWKNNFPVPGRGDAPLLFDANGEPKPAFFRIVENGGLC